MTQACSDCTSYAPLEGVKDLSGECRHHAPKPHLVSREGALDKMRVYAEWPVVFSDQWCGKFATRAGQSE